MMKDVVPVAWNMPKSGSRVLIGSAEARVRDGVDAVDERHVPGELDRRSTVQDEARTYGRVTRVVSLTSAKSLDDVADRMRVPVVHEQRRFDL
jgi:hypothetical protein